MGMFLKWIGLGSLACLGCVWLAACGVEAPSAVPAADAPSDSPPAPAPGAPEDPEPEEPGSEGQEGASDAPSVWCGTGRMGGRRVMGEWQKPEAKGARWKRLFVRRDAGVWVLVTEWGEERDGRFETWQEVSALPRVAAVGDDAQSTRRWTELSVARWTDQLHDPDEEVAFRAVLALGQHGSGEVIRDLLRLVNERERVQVAVAAAIALRELGNLVAVDFLLRGLQHSDAVVRSAVLEALEGLTGHVVSVSEERPEDVPEADDERWRQALLRKAWRDWWRTNGRALRLQVVERDAAKRAAGDQAGDQKTPITGESAPGK